MYISVKHASYDNSSPSSRGQLLQVFSLMYHIPSNTSRGLYFVHSLPGVAFIRVSIYFLLCVIAMRLVNNLLGNGVDY